MNKAKLAVVIPCHNSAHTIERAVNSALDADEIIIVDDNSTDGLGAFIAIRYPLSRIRYTCIGGQFPSGVCHARNVGITLAQSELIIPLDADDYFLPGGITAFKNAWQPNSIIYSNWREVDTNGAIVRDVTAPPPGMINRKNIAQATICYSKQQWLTVGGYDPDFNLGVEDWALMCAFVAAGMALKRIPIVTYAYEVKDTGRAARCLNRAEMIRGLLKEKYPAVIVAG